MIERHQAGRSDGPATQRRILPTRTAIATKPAEGVLSVMPPPDSEHAMIASRLFACLIMAGWPAEQVLQAVGVRIPGPDGDGGRIPGISVWRKPPP